jgi:uncharacterized protein (TIGR02996 family)
MTDERAFLTALLERPDDDATKLVYADWLEEQGDPRGEYLRLMLQVRRGRVVTAEQRQGHQELGAELAELGTQESTAWRSGQGSSPENRQRMQRQQALGELLADHSRQIRQLIPPRLQELAATLDPNWLAVVSDPEIEGCGKTAGEGWRPRFEFVCDKTWADLKPTGDGSVRHCETCSQNVHFCDNLADAREHSQEGHCIAVDLGIIRRAGDLQPPSHFLGRPSKEDLRESYEEGMDLVSQARLAARKEGKKKRPRRRSARTPENAENPEAKGV